jgi:protein-S-isoprenylcysteine O-methyltransferase Ste14
MNLMFLVIGISVLWVASEIVLTGGKRSRRDRSKRADQSSQLILWATILASIAAGVLVAMTGIGTIMSHRRVWVLAGMMLIVAGLIIRWVAILTLKKSFTVDVAISPGQRILQRGIYRLVRHPSYTGGLLSFLGLGVSFANWLSILVIIVPTTAAFLHRVRIEEAVLFEAFGDEYAGYASRTRRFIPFLFNMLL